MIFPEKYAATPDASTGFALFRAYEAWSSGVKRALRQVGLTHPQVTVLTVTAYLARNAEPPSQADVAAMSGIDPMTVSAVVRKLERRGLIGRTRNPADSRAWSLALTPSGQAALGEAFPLVEAANEAFFRVLDDEAGFRDQLHRLRMAVAPPP
ncbi:MAG: MarR family winged helix-turn-helix transcriptional regulator [Propionibacteriaceae bacterium]|nr:MarR family winged helix-turn-helix transcriptional regulator [Propionibacteriaceae bacterium]